MNASDVILGTADRIFDTTAVTWTRYREAAAKELRILGMDTVEVGVAQRTIGTGPRTLELALWDWSGDSYGVRYTVRITLHPGSVRVTLSTSMVVPLL